MSLNKNTNMSLNLSFLSGVFQGSQELSTQRYRNFYKNNKLNLAQILTVNIHSTSILNSNNNNNQDKIKLDTNLELSTNTGEPHLEQSSSHENYNYPQVINLLEYNSDTDVIPQSTNNELQIDMELTDQQKFLRFCDLKTKKACTSRLTNEEEAELANIYEDFILQGLYQSELQDPHFIHTYMRENALPTILEEEEEEANIFSDDSDDDGESDFGSSSGSSDYSESSSSESSTSSDSSGTNSKLASNYNNSYFIYCYNKFIEFLLEFIFTFLPILTNELFVYLYSLFV